MPGPIRGRLYTGDDGESAMLRVYCQECNAHMADVARDEVERRIKSGQYVTRRAYMASSDNATFGRVDNGIFGVCRACADKPVRGGSAEQADAQMIRIRDRVELIRERRSDLTLEQAVRAAVEYEFLPQHEADRGFRAYLLGEGAPKDEAIEAAAREFMAAAFGPDAGGAA